MDDALIRYSKKKIMRMLLFPLRLLKVKKNKVLLINDLGYNYAANPKAVAEELLKLPEGTYELVYSVRSPELYRDMEQGKIRFVRYRSIAYYYHAMTAKVLLSNSGGYSFLPLKKRQVVINTHHGGGAYKKAGLDMYEDTPLFRKDLMLTSRSTTRFLSTNRRFTEAISASYLIEKEKFWEIGMPRNDQMLHLDKGKRDQIRAKLGIKDNQKLVLYAPTYRKPNDNYFKDSIAIDYGIDCSSVCRSLETRFGGQWIFGYRLHPCIVDRSGIIPEDTLDLCDYEDMQDLLVAADAMINDFSSSMWDFMLTGKPCFTYAKDLEHYVATTEVYTPVAEWPFPQSTTNEELVGSIIEFDEESYRIACQKHYESLGGCETGQAAELVAKYIYDKCYN